MTKLIYDIFSTICIILRGRVIIETKIRKIYIEITLGKYKNSFSVGNG